MGTHGGDGGLQGGPLPRGILVRIRSPPLHCARPPHCSLQGVHCDLHGRAPCTARRLPTEIRMKLCAWHCMCMAQLYPGKTWLAAPTAVASTPCRSCSSRAGLWIDSMCAMLLENRGVRHWGRTEITAHLHARLLQLWGPLGVEHCGGHELLRGGPHGLQGVHGLHHSGVLQLRAQLPQPLPPLHLGRPPPQRLTTARLSRTAAPARGLGIRKRKQPDMRSCSHRHMSQGQAACQFHIGIRRCAPVVVALRSVNRYCCCFIHQAAMPNLIAPVQLFRHLPPYKNIRGSVLSLQVRARVLDCDPVLRSIYCRFQSMRQTPMARAASSRIDPELCPCVTLGASAEYSDSSAHTSRSPKRVIGCPSCRSRALTSPTSVGTTVARNRLRSSTCAINRSCRACVIDSAHVVNDRFTLAESGEKEPEFHCGARTLQQECTLPIQQPNWALFPFRQQYRGRKGFGIVS